MAYKVGRPTQARHARPCAGHPRLSFLGKRRRRWPGHRRAEATPSFGRLCPAMTMWKRQRENCWRHMRLPSPARSRRVITAGSQRRDERTDPLLLLSAEAAIVIAADASPHEIPALLPHDLLVDRLAQTINAGLRQAKLHLVATLLALQAGRRALARLALCGCCRRGCGWIAGGGRRRWWRFGRACCRRRRLLRVRSACERHE